jgi:phytoene dehydrogenase-like protein
VLERASELGGRGRSEGPAGFALNLGPHALYPSARRRLRELGILPTGGVPESGLTMRIGDRILPLPTGAFTLLGSGLSASAKWELGRMLTRTMIADPPPTTVDEWLRSLGSEARGVMHAFVRVATYSNAPDRLRADVASQQLRSARVHYLDDGWQHIVDALRERARSLGVEIRTHARASAIETERGSLRAVRIGDERIACEHAIVTLGPRSTRTLIGEAASPTLAAFAERAVPVRAACLDVALDALPRKHPTLVLGIDRPTYLSVHSNVARVAPNGGAAVHVAKYLPPGERIDSAVRAELEAELDFAQPGWREHVVTARYSPALLVMHALAEIGLERPTVLDSGVVGLFLAGDWVGPNGLLFDACLESAQAAAQDASAIAA